MRPNPTLSLRAQSQTLSAVVGAALLLAACSSNHGPGGGGAGGGAANGPPPTPVMATKIQRDSIESATELDGQVVPYLQASIATQTSGTVISVYANQGDHVRAGQILAKIDDAPLQAQLAQQVGSRTQASAKLDQARTQEPITSQTSNSALLTAKESLQQARQQLLTDQAALHQNQLTAQADEKLLGQGYVSTTQNAQARAAYVASQQTLIIDQSRVSQMSAALRAAERNLGNINLQKEVIDENRGAVAQAEGSTQLLRTQIGESTLTAPFDGVVTQRLLDPGAYAGPNQPIFSLAEINPVYVTFNVKDSDLPYVHAGTPITFKTTAVPGRIYHGRVSVINVVPTPGTLLYPARLTVSNSDESLRGGMLVNVAIVKARAVKTLTAPTLGVSLEANGAAVYAITPHENRMIAMRIPVKVGISTADKIQISSPAIHDGMQIISAKPDTLQDNGPVAVVPPGGGGPPGH